MKTLFKLVLGLGFLVTAAVVGAGLYLKAQLDPANLRVMIQERGSELLGRPIAVERVEVDYTGGLELGGISMSAPPGTSATPALPPPPGAPLRIDRLRLEVSYPLLLTGTLAPARVEVVRPRLVVRVAADGSTDLDDLKTRLTGDLLGASTGSVPPPRVLVRDGEVRIRRPVASGPGAGTRTGAGTGRDLEIVDLDLDLAATFGGAIEIEASGQLGTDRLRIDGVYRIATQELVLDEVMVDREGTGTLVALDGGQISRTATGWAFRPAAMTLGGMTGTLEGRFDPGTGLAARVGLDGVEPARLGLPVEGRVPVTLKVEGPLDSLTVSGSARLAGIQAPSGAPAGSARIRVTTGEMRFEPIPVPVPLAFPSGPIRVALAGVELDLEGAGPLGAISLPRGRVVVTRDAVIAEELEARVLGYALSPKLQVRGLTSKPEITFESGRLEVDLARAVELAPPGRRRELVALAPRGTMRIDVKVTGTPGALTLSGHGRFRDLSLAAGPGGERVELSGGDIALRENRVELEPTALRVGGATLRVSGVVADPLGTPRASGQIGGRGIEIETLGRFLPEALADLEPKIRCDLDLRFKKGPEGLDLAGTVRPRGGGFLLGGEPRRVVRLADGGEIRFSGNTVQVERLPLEVEGIRAGVNARLARHPDRIEIEALELVNKGMRMNGSGRVRTDTARAVLAPLALRGSLDPSVLAPGTGVTGEIALSVELTGPPAAANLAGEVEGGQLVIGAADGGRLILRDLAGTLGGEGSRVRIDPLSARLAGGTVKGHLVLAAGHEPEFAFQLAGLSLASLRQELAADPAMVQGTLDGRFAGRGTPRTLTGSGQVVARDLVVNPGSHPWVAENLKSLGNGALGGAVGATLAGLLLKNRSGIGELLRTRGPDALRAAEILRGLGDPQPLGTLEADVNARDGIVDVGPFQNAKISGQVRIDLVQRRVHGRYGPVVMGDLTLAKLIQEGPFGNTRFDFERADLLYKGKPLLDLLRGSSGTTAGTATGAAGGSLEDQIRRQAGDRIREALGGALGLPEGIIGGPDGESEGGEPGVSGLDILEGLGGGDGRDAPGNPPAPPPEPPGEQEPDRPTRVDIEEIGKREGLKLLEKLFR